jgi:hypothetical protein
VKAGTFEVTDGEGKAVTISAPNFHLLDGALELERRHLIGEVSQGAGHRDTPHAMREM